MYKNMQRYKHTVIASALANRGVAVHGLPPLCTHVTVCPSPVFITCAIVWRSRTISVATIKWLTANTGTYFTNGYMIK